MFLICNTNIQHSIISGWAHKDKELTKLTFFFFKNYKRCHSVILVIACITTINTISRLYNANSVAVLKPQQPCVVNISVPVTYFAKLAKSWKSKKLKTAEIQAGVIKIIA